MMTPLLRTLACFLLAVFAAVAPARAEEDCGDVERNYELIKADAVSVQTNMALFAAADRGCEPLARKLLDAGASLLARDRRGAMPLAHAAREGRIKLVELFLAGGAPIDARNVDGGTALFAAADGQKHSTVALLLAKGADPNLAGPLRPHAAHRRGVQGQRPHRRSAACARRRSRTRATQPARRRWSMRPRAASTISCSGSSTPASTPRARYGNDLTALMWAAGHDDGVGAAAVTRVVDLLLAHGAGLDDADNRGRTALMIAAELGDAGVVDLLLQRGADRARKDKDGKTALDLAANADVRERLAAK